MNFIPSVEAFERFLQEDVRVELNPEGIRLPHTKREFYMVMYVDDNCAVCPVALRLAEATEKLIPLRVTAINLSHAKADRTPSATPAFCLSLDQTMRKCVYWEGIPLGNQWEPFLSRKLELAYIATHPYLPEFLDRAQAFAESHNLVIALDAQMRNRLLRELMENYDNYGQPYCPCRQERSQRTVCPCVYALGDVAKYGHCLCGLFWSRPFAEKWLEAQKRRHAKDLEKVDKMISILQELKTSIILNDRAAVEKALDSLMSLYTDLASEG